MTGTIDLSPAELHIVRDVLRTTLPPGCRVWVFGSRATGTARRYSDLDLALECDSPLGFDLLARITEALSNSDLAYKVDILDLRSVDPAVRAIIQSDMVALPC